MVLALFFEVKSHTKIDDSGLHSFKIDDYVLRFDVPMNYVPLVAFQ